ncbi:MAG: haloacid dehalogenase type II [Actinobacteria bacterium]|nr:haloacid dehalogenase type II [Actinomycetota bacterium]
MQRPRLLVFDVNDTLLDIGPLIVAIERVVGAPAGEWFIRTLHGSVVANEIGGFRPFDEIGVESLLELARLRGLKVREDTARRAMDTMTRLPAKPGVYNALERLFDTGYTMVALTNGSTTMANAQIENAGLHVFIQRVISVDEVGLFKPASEVYVHAAKTMKTPIQHMMMVAAHAWDCAGAMATGARAAYVSPHGVWPASGPAPELVVEDIAGLATVLAG